MREFARIKKYFLNKHFFWFSGLRQTMFVTLSTIQHMNSQVKQPENEIAKFM